MSDHCTIVMEPGAGARLSGVLTFQSVPALYREAENLFQGHGSELSLDLSGITAADSAGLALLLEWQATRKRSSRSLRITQSPASLMSLARLCEADEVLNMSGRKQVA